MERTTLIPRNEREKRDVTKSSVILSRSDDVGKVTDEKHKKAVVKRDFINKARVLDLNF